MASREYGQRGFGDHISRTLEPVEVGGQVYLTNDARRIGELRPLVPDNISDNDLHQFLELVNRISSERRTVKDRPDGKENLSAPRDITAVNDWL